MISKWNSSNHHCGGNLFLFTQWNKIICFRMNVCQLKKLNRKKKTSDKQLWVDRAMIPWLHFHYVRVRCEQTNDDLRVSHQGNRCCRSHENSFCEFYEVSRFEGENVHQFNYNVRRQKPPHEWSGSWKEFCGWNKNERNLFKSYDI